MKRIILEVSNAEARTVVPALLAFTLSKFSIEDLGECDVDRPKVSPTGRKLFSPISWDKKTSDIVLELLVNGMWCSREHIESYLVQLGFSPTTVPPAISRLCKEGILEQGAGADGISLRLHTDLNLFED